MTKQNRTIEEILEELQTLKDENYFLKRQNNALKLRCNKYSLEIRDLESEIANMRFTRKYLTSEEAGKAFAQSLIGGH